MTARKEGEGYVAFLFHDEQYFSQTGYKLILSGSHRGLLPCTQVRFNGQLKLIYLTKEYRRLEKILPTVSQEGFLKIMASLIETLLDLRENTFLKCGSLEFAADRIFVDHMTKEVYLIYLPLMDDSVGTEWFEFDAMLRANMADWCGRLATLPEERVRNFYIKLKDHRTSLRDILTYLRSENPEEGEKAEEPEMEKETPPADHKEEQPKTLRLVLRGISPGQAAEFHISSDGFILGRSPYRADGQISGNLRVGNVHCRVLKRGELFFVEDLQSRNGTFINGNKLNPGEKRPIKKGDILKLADCSFRADTEYTEGEMRGV